MKHSTESVSCGIYYKGILHKQSSIFKMWQKCFCELQLNELYIRKSEDAEILDHRVPITSKTLIELNENQNFFTIFVSNENHSKSQKGEFLFKCTSEEDAMKWYVALKSASLNITSHYSLESFKILSVIGRGYYGKVMLVQDKTTNQLFALKTLHKARLIRSKQIGTAITELNILKRIEGCPFIVGLKFAFQTATKFYIGLEFVQGGDILNIFTDMSQSSSSSNINLNQINENTAFSLSQSNGTDLSLKPSQSSYNKYILEDQNIRLYVAEIAFAIDFLHENKIIYRDLKPENILIGIDGHLKLTDFGSSKDFTLAPNHNIFNASTFCGTPEYIAPEMIKKEKYSFEIDWWALGIFAYELYFDQTPFVGNTNKDTYKNILEMEPKFPENIDPDIKDFIKLLLQKDPKNRADFQKLKDHPFWKDLDLEKVYNKQVPSKFIPIFEDGNNLKYFDSVFTNETPLDSSAQPVIGTTSFIPGFEYCDRSYESSEYSSDPKINHIESEDRPALEVSKFPSSINLTITPSSEDD